jgi:hypothetical protein
MWWQAKSRYDWQSARQPILVQSPTHGLCPDFSYSLAVCDDLSGERVGPYRFTIHVQLGTILTFTIMQVYFYINGVLLLLSNLLLMCHNLVRPWPYTIGENEGNQTVPSSAICVQTNFVALSPRANYTDWATATYRRNLMPTFVDRGVSRGQAGGSPTVVNLSFLDRSRYSSFK